LRVKFFVDQEHTIVSRVRLARRFEGPPGHAHGGIIATLLDEAMSKANRQFGVLAMTRHVEVEYLTPVPLGARLLVTGRHNEFLGKKTPSRGTDSEWGGCSAGASDGLVYRGSSGDD
jgi:acyl-coenzyme A thioesterase PaaI-like protein